MDLVENTERVHGLLSLAEQMREAIAEVEQLAHRQLSQSEIDTAMNAIVERLRESIDSVAVETGQIVPVFRMN